MMFTHFEEENILTETRNDTESGDESDSKSLMMNEQDMFHILFVHQKRFSIGFVITLRIFKSFS